MTATAPEITLRRCLAAAADTVTPADALEEIRSRIAARRSLRSRIRAAVRRVTAAVSTPRKGAHVFTQAGPGAGPTVPAQLVPTDVIIQDPQNGHPGEWTFLKAIPHGAAVRLQCLAADGKTDVELIAGLRQPIHIAPRGGAFDASRGPSGDYDAFWGAA